MLQIYLSLTHRLDNTTAIAFLVVDMTLSGARAQMARGTLMGWQAPHNDSLDNMEQDYEDYDFEPTETERNVLQVFILLCPLYQTSYISYTGLMLQILTTSSRILRT